MPWFKYSISTRYVSLLKINFPMLKWLLKKAEPASFSPEQKPDHQDTSSELTKDETTSPTLFS